jgi:hypothetical protein
MCTGSLGGGRRQARKRASSDPSVKVERVPLSAQLQAVHNPVKRCLQPRKIFVWRCEQQIKIQRRFNLDSVFALRAPPRQPSPILVCVESLVDEVTH